MSERTDLDLFPSEASLPPSNQRAQTAGTDPRLLFDPEGTNGLLANARVIEPPAPQDEEAPPEATDAVGPDVAVADRLNTRPLRWRVPALLGAVLAVKLALAFAIRAWGIPLPNAFIAAETEATATPASQEVPPVASMSPPPPLVSSPETAIAPPPEQAVRRAEATRWWAPKDDVKPAAVTRPRVTPPPRPRPERSDAPRDAAPVPKPRTASLPWDVVSAGVAPASVTARASAPLVSPPASAASAAPAPPPERAPLPVPAAPTSVRPPPPAEIAPRPEVSERAAVERVLDGYRDAFSQLDVEAAQSVWPTVNGRTLERAFSQLQSQHVSFRDCAISVAASQAYATCEGTAHYVPRVGSRDTRAENRTWNFTLTKDGQRWVILSVNSR